VGCNIQKNKNEIDLSFIKMPDKILIKSGENGGEIDLNLIKRNIILVCFSQICAWVLLVVLAYNRLLNKFLYPAVNNRPAAFTLSIWLIQTLIVTNLIVYFINRIWMHSSDKANKLDMKLQSKKIAILHILVSVLHVILFCSIFLLIFGGEDL